MFVFGVGLYVFVWGGVLLIMSVCFLGLFFVHVLGSSSLAVAVSVFVSDWVSFELFLSSDVYTSLFSSVVCFVSAVVFMFSSSYFSSYHKYTYFCFLTFLFVCSMLIVVNFNDIFFVMLGWDGLGVVSYFLIVYYQSPVAANSALCTILINRLGDGLFVLSIIFYSVLLHTTSFSFYSYPVTISFLFLLLVTFSTNSALFPFSPWLPAAIAAPTPISALVHSSTLVTAGLFLLIRCFPGYSQELPVLKFLIVLGLFTSFYAGLASMVQPDINKVVALSTLSHLGFICFAIGLGWVQLAFFHLLSHALFKSSLFIGLGMMISNHLHYQDSRYFSSLSVVNPYSMCVVLISSANLLGLPFLSGFYSNDLVLESFGYGVSSGFMFMILVVNLLFTFSYTFRLFVVLFDCAKLSPYLMPVPSAPSASYFVFIFVLSSLSVVFGVGYVNLLVQSGWFVPLVLKFIPVVLLNLFLVSAVVWAVSFPSSFYYLVNIPAHFGVSMLYLVGLWTQALPNASVTGWNSLNRALEFGGLYFFVVSSFMSILSFLGVVINYCYKYVFRNSLVLLLLVGLAFVCVFI